MTDQQTPGPDAGQEKPKKKRKKPMSVVLTMDEAFVLRMLLREPGQWARLYLNGKCMDGLFKKNYIDWVMPKDIRGNYYSLIMITQAGRNAYESATRKTTRSIPSDPMP